MSKRKKKVSPLLLLKDIIANPNKKNHSLKDLIKDHSWEEIQMDLKDNPRFYLGRHGSNETIDKIPKKKFNTAMLLIDQAYYKKQVKNRRKFKAVITLITILSLGTTWPLTKRIYNNVKQAEPLQRRSGKKMRRVIENREKLELATTAELNALHFNKRGELRKQIEEKSLDPEKFKLLGTPKQNKAFKIKYAYMSQEQAEINDTLYKFFKKSKRKQEKHKKKIKEKVALIKARSQRR